MTDAIRIQVKLPARGELAALTDFIPVFHRYIQDDAIGELLVDVADYAHVPDGPGIVLIGHESDYGIDIGLGGPGLLYARKRDATGDFETRLRDALKRALFAAKLLEGEKLTPELRFRTDELYVRIADRLRAPNDDATFAALAPSISRVLDGLYGPGNTTIARHGDAREMFTVHVKAKSAPSVDALASKLS